MFAQNFYLHLVSENKNEQQIIDSLTYQIQHATPKSVTDEVAFFSEKLTHIGYLQSRIADYQKQNDSTFNFKVNIGVKTDFVNISTVKSPVLKKLSIIEGDSVWVAFEKVKGFMESVVGKVESQGYSMSKVRLENFSFEKNILKADLTEEITLQRTLDDIVVLGYQNFPEGHRRQLMRMYKNRVFNQQTLIELQQDIQKFAFVNQLKSPEILFTSDSTRVFLYLEKSKANNFDGYVGFTTNEDDKVVFTGYLDLSLNNALNSGEQFKLYWKNDGNDQQTFSFSAELPYLFQTPLALRGDINIFKQDSTFQNTKTNLELGYYFKYNFRGYVGYSAVNSNDIQGQSTAVINDFESKFYTSSFEYFDLNRDDFLFPEHRRLMFKTGIGNRQSSFGENNQFFVELHAQNNFYLNPKNIIHLDFEGYYLDSEAYLISELYRFGGINSVRGFNENSLQASFLSALKVEYRYVLAPTIYVHSITDYGYFQDKAIDVSQSLLGLGFGLGLYTNNGLFNIVYANGSTDGQEIKFSNSIIHLSFKARF